MVISQHDFCFCREMGYHNAGEYFKCSDCGAEGNASEIACVGAIKNQIGAWCIRRGCCASFYALRSATGTRLRLTRCRKRP